MGYHVFDEESNGISNKLALHFEGAKLKSNRSSRHGILKFEIIDTGCGISEDCREKLFNPFAQEDSSNTRKYGGTGLSLFIVKQVVEKMKGEIRVHSKKNHGSNFIVLLPCEMDIMNHNDSFKNRVIPDKKVKALIVDDDPGNHLVMSRYLDKLGVNYEIANDGKEAYQKYIEHEFGYYTFITMDIQMPKVDGITCAKLIREYEERNGNFENQIHIVFVSGNCREDEIQMITDPKGLVRGAGFFRKPIKYLDLQNTINGLLNNQIRSMPF
jgi:CheY-like chemotaxis protein